MLRPLLQVPKLIDLPIALLPAVAASCTVPAVQYVIDRVHWATHFYGRALPPQVSRYFNPSSVWQPLLLLMVFAAFAEEFIFRGLFLPRFIDRYGFHRGMFLTGIAWAAIHFRSDTYSGLSPGGVLVHLANRIFLCLVLNCIFSWLTLRSGSIIPAAIAHTVWNLWTEVLSHLDDRWEVEFRFVLAAVIAYILFRFWPISVERETESVSPDTAPEPAV